MRLYLSTTGTDFFIQELGFAITHPTVDYDIMTQFSDEEIAGAESLTNAIKSGVLVWRVLPGGDIQNPVSYDADFAESLNLGNQDSGNNASLVRQDIAKYYALSPNDAEITSVLNGTHQLTNLSSYLVTIYGTADNFSINLPNASTVSPGRSFEIVNKSTKIVNVKDFNGSAVRVLPQGCKIIVTLKHDNSWHVHDDRSVPFLNNLYGFTSVDVRSAIYEAYVRAKGIKTFPFDLHYISGTGLNTTMPNGSFFRVRPGTFSSGSYSGYPAAFPLQTPFACRLYSITLTFRSAAFDFNANSGPILFEIETRDHVYNGSSIANRILVRFGNFSLSGTGTDTFRYELFFNDTGGEGFSYISGTPEIGYAKMIGCRFVKAPSGDRRINSFTDIIMKLNYEEVVV